MTKKIITITKLERELHDGDWHDAPLRWKVQVEGAEHQHFSTKKQAQRWASLRRVMSLEGAFKNF